MEIRIEEVYASNNAELQMILQEYADENYRIISVEPIRDYEYKILMQTNS